MVLANVLIDYETSTFDSFSAPHRNYPARGGEEVFAQEEQEQVWELM